MKKVVKNLFVVLFIIGVFGGGKTNCYASEIKYTDNVIPAMTSDTSPSGTASASSIYNTTKDSFPAYLAFDHHYDILNGWVTEKTSKKGWLCYEFVEAKCITKYTIVSRSSKAGVHEETVVEELPKTWTFEAWNGEKWIILDERNVTDWQYAVKKEFTFSNNEEYRKYRINITDNNGMVYTSIGELEMMETASNSSTTPDEYKGNRAILEIVMTNNTIKEYDLTAEELENFLTWYDNRSEGTGKSYYRMIKRSNVKPFNSRYEYLQFKKIYSFEVKDYTIN